MHNHKLFIAHLPQVMQKYVGNSLHCNIYSFLYNLCIFNNHNNGKETFSLLKCIYIYKSITFISIASIMASFSTQNAKVHFITSRKEHLDIWLQNWCSVFMDSPKNGGSKFLNSKYFKTKQFTIIMLLFALLVVQTISNGYITMRKLYQRTQQR